MAAATQQPIQLGGIRITFLVDAEDSGGSTTMFETRVAKDAMVPPPHSHDGFDETVYGLEGEVSLWVDGDDHVLGVGDSLCVRRGQVHRFENTGDGEAVFLSVSSPGIFGPNYFNEIAAVFNAAAGGPPDKVAVLDVMRRHGLTPAPPPT